jgi:integrase
MRLIERLSPRKVQTAKPTRGQRKANFLDGGGLHLCVTTSTGTTFNRSWVFKYELDGRRHEIGLGPLYDVSIHDAREEAKRLRGLLRQSIDPLDHKQQRERDRRLEAGKKATFEADAEAYFNLHESAWSLSHARQWKNSVEQYLNPHIGKTPVSQIDSAMLLNIITPIWKTKTETASRLINRLQVVLDFATAHNHRTGDNPANNLLALLPKKSKIKKVRNYEAVPYTDIPALMQALSVDPAPGAMALRLLILTALRPSEIRLASWNEIADGVLVIPAERMKRRIQHRVPLSQAALDLLAQLPGDGLLFPDVKEKHMGDALRRAGHKDATPHGTARASFRQWAEEHASEAHNVIESALAHRVAVNKTEEAYRRDLDLLNRRRPLIEQWATYCTGPVRGGDNIRALEERRARLNAPKAPAMTPAERQRRHRLKIASEVPAEAG